MGKAIKGGLRNLDLRSAVRVRTSARRQTTFLRFQSSDMSLSAELRYYPSIKPKLEQETVEPCYRDFGVESTYPNFHSLGLRLPVNTKVVVDTFV